MTGGSAAAEPAGDAAAEDQCPEAEEEEGEEAEVADQGDKVDVISMQKCYELWYYKQPR